MNATRAKLYVSSLSLAAHPVGNDHLTGDPKIGAPYGKAILTPVYSPNPDSENHAFWTATPCGGLALGVGGMGEPADAYPLGSFWYADVVEDAEGDIELRVATKSGDEDPNSAGHGSLQVELARFHEHDQRHLRLTMSVSNKAAWPTFDRPLGTRFRVVLSPATRAGG